jgi:uncharacterized protein YcnI
MRKQIAVVPLVFAVAAALQAHVIVTPRESVAGAEQVYTVRVPTEGTVTTTSLELEIPAGLHVMEVAAGDGFTVDLKKENNRIAAITWKREIKPKEFALFTFTAHNPASGALQWKAHQYYADGSSRHWVGDPGTKDPASVTKIVPKGGAPPAPAADHKH